MERWKGWSGVIFCWAKFKERPEILTSSRQTQSRAAGQILLIHFLRIYATFAILSKVTNVAVITVRCRTS